MFKVECRDESQGIYGSKWEVVAQAPSEDEARVVLDRLLNDALGMAVRLGLPRTPRYRIVPSLAMAMVCLVIQ